MPKRSSKRDANEIAKSIVDQVADEVKAVEEPAKPEKNPAAVALGRLGGKKGGPARLRADWPRECVVVGIVVGDGRSASLRGRSRFLG